MKRIGFHYYPDTQHYQQSDYINWLPKLENLGASWLVLKAPVSRALPEWFIQGLRIANIEPILHFAMKPDQLPPMGDLDLLLRVYARWGVKYVVLFDLPNSQHTWGGSAWAQSDLVERFLDIYQPLADMVLKYDLTPIFPPLQPGGDYWDTSFLREALESLVRREQDHLLDKLILGVQAWAGDRPIDWGMGGPERWPGAIPYYTPSDEQDQRGFRIFDWYETIARSVLRQPLPMFLFGLGAAVDDAHADKMLQMMRLLAGIEIEGQSPISDFVLGGAFELLDSSRGWIQPNGEELPIFESIRNLQATKPIGASSTPKEGPTISHYLLLPSYEWGIPDYHLDAIRPFIKNHQPTVGFSLEEAAQARRVTVIGSEQDYPDDELRALRNRGCVVERIEADGTTLATDLDKLLAT
jgi:hypothetical protein